MFQSIGRTTVALAAAATLSLIVSTGCFSYTTGHTATPVEKGRGNISARAGYTGVTSSGDVPGGNVPYFEFAGRYGISDNVGIGAKLYPIGVGLDLNVAAVNSESFALSINPAFSFVTTGSIGGQGSATYGTALANVLTDVVKTENFILTLGLKPGILYAFSNVSGITGQGVNFALGGTIGAKIWASDSFAIMPWIDVLSPVGAGPGSRVLFTGMIGATYKI
jgi:hypothetical protein